MILVTGATGLVGTHLLVKLVQEKQPIRALYRSETKKEHAREVFSYYFAKKDQTVFDTIDWVKGDITDIPSLTDAFEGVTHVYHCAAWITFNAKHYKNLRKVNIEGTANIVNLCLVHHVKKLCYVSSIATLEEDPAVSFIDETAEWNPETQKSVYAITKYGAEMEVWRGTQENLKVVIVNPGIIIGPGYFNGGSGFMFKKIHAGMKYYTTGTTGYVAVTDVINIMHQLMTGNHQNQRYIVVAENLSYKDAFTKIALALNKPAPTKEATSFLLYVAYYLQLVSHFLFRTKRSIFKSSIRSALSNSFYKNDKVKEELNYTFSPVDIAINETATRFLKNF
ncbi:NAD-dependent epimerase/dehydratase family protein [Aquimarina gracilis]|uniref:NAD-dependent epimerase/dehydratase family protein n=1 Tax=Aquimarina gracilis TaxID=874422 RepID=A0ABU6A0F7_9FLAO|nr:NAD-dependent epimerase/dehydratase family protein [Aquimarina gracilis]MEB3347638.1 NAD-dependent epimerase/dehydratase family protein [Aquimarina gracilis]